MEELFNNTVLDKLFEERNEKMSYAVIKNSQDYLLRERALQSKLSQLLEYVPKEKYTSMEREIEDFIFDHIGYMSEYWCSKYYKVGFADGLNVKKEVQTELEELDDEQNVG